MRRLLLLATLLLVSMVAPLPGAAQGAPSPLVDLAVTGSPLVWGDDGARIEAIVTLAQAAEVDVRVSDFDGRTVRTLFDGPRLEGRLRRSWRGRDAAGDPVPDGPYRIVARARADGVTEKAEAWVTVAGRRIYPAGPELITVVVDPGHGGEFDGAEAPDGTREADLNLDIGLRLARMLEGAGVNAVITRTEDSPVNMPPADRTGDGVIDIDDDLAARPDVANLTRADLFLSVHNNEAVNTSVGGPSTSYFDERPFGDRSARLARIVQDEMVAALREFAGGGRWQPHDHGVLIYPYYVLRGPDPPRPRRPPRLRRPTQMPGVLSEGLFLTNPRELRLLKRPAVRSAMAGAYYNAIARYLAGRGHHVGYELVSAPASELTAGERATYEVEVRNAGTEPMRRWRVLAAAHLSPFMYVGRPRPGVPVGEARVPRLEPGESTTVNIDIEAPGPGGDWMLTFDAHDGDGGFASRLGSPRLQAPLVTLDPPDPSPAPSPIGS